MKRGQFYLLAAFFIIVIVSGLSYVYIKADKINEKRDIRKLAEEIYYESSQTIDSGIFKGSNTENIVSDLKNLGEYYLRRYPYIELVIVYGDEQKTNVIQLKKIVLCHKQGNDRETMVIEIEAAFGEGNVKHFNHGDTRGPCEGDSSFIAYERDMKIKDAVVEDNELTIPLDAEKEISLDIEEGKRNFYVIVTRIDGEESDVIVK